MVKLLVLSIRVFREFRAFLLGHVFLRWCCRILFRLSSVLTTTRCGFGIGVSPRSVRSVKLMAIRRRIVSLTESVGSVAPQTTRRTRAPGRGASPLLLWRLQFLWWCLTPLRLLYRLSPIVLFWMRVRTNQLRMLKTRLLLRRM